MSILFEYTSGKVLSMPRINYYYMSKTTRKTVMVQDVFRDEESVWCVRYWRYTRFASDFMSLDDFMKHFIEYNP